MATIHQVLSAVRVNSRELVQMNQHLKDLNGTVKAHDTQLDKHGELLAALGVVAESMKTTKINQARWKDRAIGGGFGLLMALIGLLPRCTGTPPPIPTATPIATLTPTDAPYATETSIATSSPTPTTTDTPAPSETIEPSPTMLPPVPDWEEITPIVPEAGKAYEWRGTFTPYAVITRRTCASATCTRVQPFLQPDRPYEVYCMWREWNDWYWASDWPGCLDDTPGTTWFIAITPEQLFGLLIKGAVGTPQTNVLNCIDGNEWAFDWRVRTARCFVVSGG